MENLPCLLVTLVSIANIIIGINYLTPEPKGIRANFATLKCCRPNGIPITVIQRRRPNTADSIASGILILISKLYLITKNLIPPYSTSFPNGKKTSFANLKHCIPIGIPIIVIDHKSPKITK